MSIPGTTPSPAKIYPGSADEEFLKVFDMTVNDTSMYGTYSVTRPIEPEGVEPINKILTDEEYQDNTEILAVNLTSHIVDVKMEDDIETGVDDLDGGSF